nr:probable glutamate receptor [Cherax quadricarinatus]
MKHQPLAHQKSTERPALDHLLTNLWADWRTTCRGLILDLTYSSSSSTQQALRLVQISGLWQLPETRVLVVGERAGVKDVLLHHSFRNTVHAFYLALHDLTLHDPSRHRNARLRKILPREATAVSGGVWVYQRCLYCNNGEQDARLFHQGSSTSVTQIFDNVFQDFMGRKMRVVTAVPYFPYVDYKVGREAAGPVMLLDSLDARIIQTFAAKLNFTFEVYVDPDQSWGEERNGIFSGMMGMLQREVMDICTISGPTSKRLRVINYLKGYPSDPMSVTSLKPTLLPKYLAFIRPFKGELWLALLVSVVSWGVVLWLLQRAWRWMVGGKGVRLHTALLYSMGTLLEQQPPDPSVSLAGQVLVGWWLVFCLIITTGFRSSLMAHLTVQGMSHPLDSFEDLVKLPGRKWGTEAWELTEAVVDFFAKHPDPVVQHIYHKMEVMPMDVGLKRVLAGGFSIISFKNYINVIVGSRYTDAYGNTPFYTSKNAVPILAAFGWGIRRGAPFYQRFTELITHLDDAAIISYWTDDLISRKTREERNSAPLEFTAIHVNVSKGEDKEVVLTMNHLQGAFYLLLVGSGVAFLTLLGENLTHWRRSSLQ